MWCCSLFIARQRLESSQSGRRQRNFVNDHEQQQPRKGFWQKCKKTTFLFFQVFFSFSSLVNLPPEQLLVPLSIAQSHHLRPWTIRRELGSWTIGGKVGRSQKCKTDDTSQPLMGPLITNIGPLRDGFLFLCNDTWHNGSVRTIKITLSRPEGICICGKTASEKSCAICWEYILGAKAGLEQNRPRTEQNRTGLLHEIRTQLYFLQGGTVFCGRNGIYLSPRVICRKFSEFRAVLKSCVAATVDTARPLKGWAMRGRAGWYFRDREKLCVLSAGGSKPGLGGRNLRSGHFRINRRPKPPTAHPHPSMHCKAILASMIKKVWWERWSLGKSFIGRGQLIKQGDVSFTRPTVFYQQNVRVPVRASSHLHPELEIVHQVHINLVHIYQVHSELFIRCIFIRYSRCQLSVCLKTAMSCMATILVFHSRNWHDRVYPNTYCNGYLGLLSVYCDEGYLWLLPSPDSLSSLLSTLLLAFPPQQHGGPSLPSTPTWRSSKNTSDNASYCIFGFSSFFSFFLAILLKYTRFYEFSSVF